MWEDGVWTCAPHVINTDNYCAPGIWLDSNGDPDGVIIFVYTDCLTRQPLGPEFQDPVYNSTFFRLSVPESMVRR